MERTYVNALLGVIRNHFLPHVTMETMFAKGNVMHGLSQARRVPKEIWVKLRSDESKAQCINLCYRTLWLIIHFRK